MDTLEACYTVTLRDYPEELPAQQRANAERRYAKELEKQFGGPEQVAAALDTMSSLEESPQRSSRPATSPCSSTGAAPASPPSRRVFGTWAKLMVRTLKCAWLDLRRQRRPQWQR